MNIKITGVNHIMITVSNLDVAKQFYGSILGLEEVIIPPEITGERIWYKLGSVVLHVNFHPNHIANLQHYGITVESGMYEYYYEKIKNTGYKKMTESKKYDDGLYRFFIMDPFENSVEISNA